MKQLKVVSLGNSIIIFHIVAQAKVKMYLVKELLNGRKGFNLWKTIKSNNIKLCVNSGNLKNIILKDYNFQRKEKAEGRHIFTT